MKMPWKLKPIIFTILLIICIFASKEKVLAAPFVQLQSLKTAGSTGTDISNSVAVDNNNNIFVIGAFGGTVDFESDSVVSGDTLTAKTIQDAFIAKYSSSNTLLWVKQIGSITGSSYDGVDIDVDEFGNVYATGYFTGTTDFDPDNIVAGDTIASNGNPDAFLVKYNSSGILQWVKGIGNTAHDLGRGVDYGEDGNVYISGEFYSDNVDFDRDNVVSGDTLNSTASSDIYIAKYNSSGFLQWVNGIGSVNNNIGEKIKGDSNGNVYVTGSFKGTVDFDENNVVVNDTRTATGTQDIFNAKYNQTGQLEWVKPAGSASRSMTGLDINYDSEGNVYTTGYSVSTVDFDVDNAISGDTFSGSGFNEIFLVKYNTNGTFVGGKNLTRERGYGIEVDNDDNVFLTGYFSGTLDFDPDQVIEGDTKTSPGSTDFFIAKYDNSLNLIWVKTGEGSGLGRSFGVDLSSNNDVIISGNYAATMDFDSDYDIEGDTITSNGSGDSFFAAYAEVVASLGPEMRVVLRDSDITENTTDIEIWFNVLSIESNSKIYITYDTSFTGGQNLTTTDITVTCDNDGIDPISGTTMSNVTVINSVEGYLILDTGSDSCSNYTVIDINGGGGNQLTNPSISGNYSWSTTVDNSSNGEINGDGATLAYVENENDVLITANVIPILDMEIYEANVDNLLNGTGVNICELGVLSINTISSCTYDVGTGTNNPSGVSVFIQSDGNLRDGSGNTIDACSGTNCDSLGGAGVTAGEEEYGIYISELGDSEYTAGGSFATQHQGIPTVETLFASSSSTGSGTTTGAISQRLEVTHAASVSTATTQGSYSHIVTYTAFTN